MSRVRLGRVFWISAAAILVAAAFVALAAVLRGEFSETDGRILVTLAALLYTGGAAIAGLAVGDRGPARRVGWTVAAAAPVSLALVLWAIWSFVWEQDNEPANKLAWSGVIALLAGLMSTTALLLAGRPTLLRLAGGVTVLASVAAAVSITGLWAEPNSDAYIKIVAALWILAALCYFLVPVLQRSSRADGRPGVVRVLAELDGVELVATRAAVDGVTVEPPAPGERLVLRRRT